MKNKTIKWVQYIGLALIIFGFGYWIYMIEIIGITYIGLRVSTTSLIFGASILLIIPPLMEETEIFNKERE